MPHSPTLGLRACNNLGNTCFMSSVLHALLRIAPLQEHYLGDKHHSSACRSHQSGSDAVCLGARQRQRRRQRQRQWQRRPTPSPRTGQYIRF